MQHHLDVDLAIKYGVPAAIVLDHLQGWIFKNRANKIHFYDKRTWTYNSIQALTAIYPYWSPRQIRFVYDELAKMGIILKGNFGTKKNDRTLWYAFVKESAFLDQKDICQKSQMDLTKMANGFDKNGKCILGTSNERTNKEPIPTKKVLIDPLSFARELNEIIPARTNSDWKAYANIARIMKNPEIILEIAQQAAKAKVDKPIALFFKMLSDVGYKRQRYTGSQIIGDVLQSVMRIA